MTKDDVIRMARSAGFARFHDTWAGDQAEVERFAQLVAAHAEKVEREACATVCDELAELNRRASSDSMWQQGECAAAIRARGQS